jgi:hypothetical protein
MQGNYFLRSKYIEHYILPDKRETFVEINITAKADDKFSKRTIRSSHDEETTEQW